MASVLMVLWFVLFFRYNNNSFSLKVFTVDKNSQLQNRIANQEHACTLHIKCNPTPSHMWCRAYKWHTYHPAVQDLSLHLLPQPAAVTTPERGIAGTIQRYKQAVGDNSQFCRQLARWTYKDLRWHTQLKRKMITHNVAWYMLLLQKKSQDIH